MPDEVPRPPPSGTVTFLFTDIEGSTRRWQDEPDAMRALLVEHDAILRDSIDKHHGHLFKHTGDGVAAAFPSAIDAVVAAVDAQARLAEVLPVRMGLHTGEAELRDGDYFGTTLNRCARLMGIAHGGQIVCSGATAELVRDRDDRRDLGEHRLRDLSRAEHVWQIGAGDFAPLRSLDVARTNLPIEVTELVGREDDLADVVEALMTARLVTLTGVGGVGKTRLAARAAAEVVERFDDGVWLVELAPLVDPSSLFESIVASTPMLVPQGQSLSAGVFRYLRDSRLLLVLDNCEHVLGAVADFVNEVLRSCANVSVLATSREALALRGERTIPVRSLDRDASIALFCARAHDARSSFSETPDVMSSVASICQRLDGIPLAIELAAARVRSLNVGDIASRLDASFKLLAGGSRGAVERHQTLRRAVDWSYQLLEPRERICFERLSVFAGGCTLDAAERVVAGEGLPGRELALGDVVDLVAVLVEKSLVQIDEHGESRYRMLETLRQFAAEKLDASGETHPLRGRHAEWCATLAADTVRGIFSAEERESTRVLEAELDNIRSATTWAIDHDVELALHIVCALGPLVPYRMNYGIAELAFAVCDAHVAEAFPNYRLALAYSAIGLNARGQYARSGAIADSVLALSSAADEATSQAYCARVGARSTAELSAGGLGEIERLFSDAARISRSLESPPLHVHVLCRAALLLCVLSERNEMAARLFADEAVAVAEPTRAPVLIAVARMILGRVLVESETDRPRGIALLESTLEQYRYLELPFYEAHALLGIARGRSLSSDPGKWSAFRKALLSTSGTQQVNLRSLLLEIAEALVIAERPEPAATMVGWTSSVAVAATTQVRAIALSNLAADKFYARGAAMTEPEIIAFALAEVDRSNEFDSNDAV